MSVEQCDGLVELLTKLIGAFAEEGKPEINVLSDGEEFLIFVHIHSVLAEMAHFLLLNVALMHLAETPVPVLDDEEVVGEEEIEVGEDAGNGLQNIPRKMEVNEVVNEPILRQQEVCKPPHPFGCSLFNLRIDCLDFILEFPDQPVYDFLQLFVPDLLNFELHTIFKHVADQQIFQGRPRNHFLSLFWQLLQ